MSRSLDSMDTTVLIVEDSRDDAVIMARALRTFGAERPSTVGAGEEALAFLARQPCDIDPAPEQAAEPEAELLHSLAGPRRKFGFYLLIDYRQLQLRHCAPTLNMRVRLGGPCPWVRRPDSRVCNGLKGSDT